MNSESDTRSKKRELFLSAPSFPELKASTNSRNHVPFDIKTDRYFEYDPGKHEASLDKLTEALRETAASNRQDNPVFLSLPNLKSQPRERFIRSRWASGKKYSGLRKTRMVAS